jgi:hypothetical protein
MILVIVCIEEHCLRRKVGIGSKSQFVPGDLQNNLETLSIVTAVMDEKSN